MRTAVAQCLRCCATNRKVAGSIPAGVILKTLPPSCAVVMKSWNLNFQACKGTALPLYTHTYINSDTFFSIIYFY